MQHLVTQVLFFKSARHVVQHQDKALNTGTTRALHVAHRGHLHFKQLPGLGGGDKLGGRAACPANDALLNAVQRMRHQLPVKHGINGTPDTHQLRSARQSRGLRQCLELQPRAVVIENDATVQIAHHHALCQFGHQRSQPVFFLLHTQAGLLDLHCHVFPQGIALRGQLENGLSQGLRLRGAPVVHGRGLGGGQENPGLLQQARRCTGVTPKQPAQGGANEHQAKQPGHADQHQTWRQLFDHQGTLPRLQGGGNQTDGQQQPDQRGHANHGNGPKQSPVHLHGVRPNI